jgi:DNA-3-methyladenine glycosylase II
VKTVSFNTVKPYNFALSLRAVNSFQPVPLEQSNQLHLATRINGNPALIEVSQSTKLKGKLMASSVQEVRESHIRRIAEWVLFAELDLMPFYHLTTDNSKLAPITKNLYGLKPMRPISLFEMAVVAITEQQISLTAAYQIRSRIVQRFGESIDNQWIFPEPCRLSQATLEDLRSCGLSRQKAQYIQELATKIVDGTLDLNTLKTLDDDKARETIMDLRGFGSWSADYILVRGLARPDCVPIDDLAIRTVVGQYLGDGQRLSSLEVTEKLEPFRPYRGLLAFYLLAEYRLKLTASD